MQPRTTSILLPRNIVAACVASILFGFVACAVAAPTNELSTTAKPQDAAAQAVSIDDILAKRKALAEQFAVLRPQQDASSTDADPTNVSAAEDELEFLDTLDGIYAQQQARLEQKLELQAAKKKADESLDSLHKFGPSEAKPYSFLLLESLRDSLAAEEDHEEAFAADIKAAEQLLETAHENFDDAEKDRRKRKRIWSKPKIRTPSANCSWRLNWPSASVRSPRN